MKMKIKCKKTTWQKAKKRCKIDCSVQSLKMNLFNTFTLIILKVTTTFEFYKYY